MSILSFSSFSCAHIHSQIKTMYTPFTPLNYKIYIKNIEGEGNSDVEEEGDVIPAVVSTSYDNALFASKNGDGVTPSPYTNFVAALPSIIQDDIMAFEDAGSNKQFLTPLPPLPLSGDVRTYVRCYNCPPISSDAYAKEEAEATCEIEDVKNLVVYTSRPLIYRRVRLYSQTGEEVSEPIVPGVRNVVAVLYYIVPENGEVVVAYTKHIEDGTYGFPSCYECPPGGRIEQGMTALGTAITETYEEMGVEHVILPGDIYTGYIVHGVTQYCFIKQMRAPEIGRYRLPRVSNIYFTPFTVKCLFNKNAFALMVDECVKNVKMTEWEARLKQIQKDQYVNVLVPRALGRFDYHRFGYKKCDFSHAYFVGDGADMGRFQSWVKGFPVHQGIMQDPFFSSASTCSSS